MGGGFHENVVTSTEVSNQEFLNTGNAAGFFAACKPGQKGSKIQVDITFPGGQSNPNSDGVLKGRTTQFRVYYMELDDADNLIGVTYSTLVTATTDNSASYTTATTGAATTGSAVENNRAEITSPLRRSYMITAPKSARWAVKVERVSVQPASNNGSDRFVWTGLKLYLDYQTTPVYGDVTLLAVRVKASQGLGEDAAIRISCRAQRLLAPAGGGSQIATRNAVDAFADIYTQAVYGANRPVGELDMPVLSVLRLKWAAHPFDFVFRNRVSVYDAMQTITRVYDAEPLPVGARMSIAESGVRPVRTALFSDANIIAGSLNLTYDFDQEDAPDGVEVEVVSERDWKPLYFNVPAGNLYNPQKIKLEGVVSPTHATEYAQLQWNRLRLQRKWATFDTELEGLLIWPGDRIGIQSSSMKWGDSALVVKVVGANRVDLDHAIDWSGAGQRYIMFKRRDGSVTDPIPASPGGKPHEVVLGAALPFTPDVDNEWDYTVAVVGEQTTLVRDFSVVTVRPNGDNTCQVECINYNPAVFDGAMSFLRAA
jgi:hypothetical protein